MTGLGDQGSQVRDDSDGPRATPGARRIGLRHRQTLPKAPSQNRDGAFILDGALTRYQGTGFGQALRAPDDECPGRNPIPSKRRRPRSCHPPRRRARRRALLASVRHVTQSRTDEVPRYRVKRRRQPPLSEARAVVDEVSACSIRVGGGRRAGQTRPRLQPLPSPSESPQRVFSDAAPLASEMASWSPLSGSSAPGVRGCPFPPPAVRLYR